ncbi:ribokinase [uncultured Dialister sp.]|jgi:ribokinase|uniref:ribokinase n=1 Tax=uncultured Dialister sp. TaxID=278064 RepID=UPI0025FA36AC|nr:ribokinase [uncultured Dialister sp.]
MGHISVIGSCNMDLTVEADRRPQAGETVMGKRLVVSPGGKGANQAVAAARLGEEVYMIGCVGDDPYGSFMLKALKDSHVKTDYVSVLEGVNTGTAHIILAEGDNSIIVIKGANEKVTRDVVDKAFDVIRTSDLVMLQHEIPMDTIGYIIDRCYEEKVPVMLNPAPYMDIPEDWIEKVTYITPNEHEAALMFKGMDRDEILKSHAGKVIMTVGKDGVLYGEKEEVVHVPGFSVSVVDTTGAGDTFNGAFAAGRCEGLSVKEAIRFANAAAALSVGKLGAQGGMPWRKDVEDMLSCKK